MSGVFQPTEAPAPAAPPPQAAPSPAPAPAQESTNPVDLILGDMGKVTDDQMRGEQAPPQDMQGYPTQQAPQPPPPPPQPPQPPPGFVPVRAVQEEREERRRLQEQQHQTQQMLLALMQRMPGGQEQQEPPPDPKTDPVGFIQANLNRLEQELQQSKQFQAQALEQQRRQAEEQQFAQAYQAQARQYMQQDPAFSDAYVFFRQRLVATHEEILGDPVAAERAADLQERQMATFAMQQGKNPAEAVRRVAQRLGWQPGMGQQLAQAMAQPQAPQQSYQQPAQGWPQQPAPSMNGPQPMVPNHGMVPPEYRNPWPQGYQQPQQWPQQPQAPQYQPDPAAAFQAIQNGQQATRSLGAGGMAGTPGEPSLQALAQMSLDDFARIPPGAWSRMMGGS